MPKPINKKGVIAEGIVVLILVFVFVILTYFGLKMMNSFNQYAVPVFNSANATSIAVKGVDTYSVFDTVFTVLLIGLILLNAITLFFIKTHPLFFVISFFAFVIVIIFAVILSNAFEDTITNSDLGNTTTFSVIPAVMENLPVVILMLLVLFSIILYAKSRGAGDFI